jgi:hypothetical protein
MHIFSMRNHVCVHVCVFSSHVLDQFEIVHILTPLYTLTKSFRSMYYIKLKCQNKGKTSIIYWV